jgi:hypothetical protein
MTCHGKAESQWDQSFIIRKVEYTFHGWPDLDNKTLFKLIT